MSDPSYADFLARKRRDWTGCGFEVALSDLPDGLFPFQARLTQWALRKGKAGVFATTGTGKTRIEAAFADKVPGRVIMLAPLCVAPQTIAEAERIGVKIGALGSGAKIEITNYERLHQVDPSQYEGFVGDETSILKSLDGKTRARLIEMFRDTPYKLCCTATPAPNDIGELANHCEFLGIMTRAEMLATFFVHDEDGWRLKGHAHQAFYRWLASWGMFLRRPSDLGFDDAGYILPPLEIHDVVVPSDGPAGEYLFAEMGLGGIRGRISARRGSIGPRVEALVDLVRRTPGQWVIWCGLNDEQDAVSKALGSECVSVAGADSEDTKRDRLEAFLRGDACARVLTSKVKIAGYGLNLQRCHQTAFLGLNDSYEGYFQAIRRFYRFGQTHPVSVYIVVSQAEKGIVANVRRKEIEAEALAESLVRHMAEAEKEEIGMTVRQRATEKRAVAEGEDWTLYLGDSAELLQEFKPESVDLTVTSPPFASLYTYHSSERDIGNSTSQIEFLDHFAFVVRGLFRVTKPGRLALIHIAQVSAQKAKDGYIGIIDIRGPIIELFRRTGWVYHGDITIQKNPQAQAVRTHAKGLLFVQLHKDASWMRPAMADYMLLFRKPGDNAVPITPDVTNDEWIEFAAPVWLGIRESDTLNVHEARDNDDDRHVCPLQLGVIERCVRLWSNPGEVVHDPFSGIASTGYVAIERGRKYVGCELKDTYHKAGVKNLTTMEKSIKRQMRLPDAGEPAP